MMQYNKPYSFEKTDVRGLFYFNFFKRNVQSKHVCQLAYNGWLGVTTYHPYEKFVSGNTQIEIFFNEWNREFKKDGEWVTEPIHEKCIRIKKDNEIIYETKSGVIPPFEVQEKLY